MCLLVSDLLSQNGHLHANHPVFLEKEEFGINLGGAAPTENAADATEGSEDAGSAASGLMGMVGKMLGGNK